MRQYKHIRKYLSEAIPYSDVMPYLYVPRPNEVIKRLDVIFNKLIKVKDAVTSKRKERVYIPFKFSRYSKKSDVQLNIETVLSANGYHVVDYVKGLAVDDTGRKIKVGKLLSRLKRKDLLNDFNLEDARKNKSNVDSYMVFSKHKYDIAGMSTNRGWDSCMNIYKNKMRRYVAADIQGGTFVVYLVSSNDMNINHPFARISIKPFYNTDKANDILYFSEVVYGTAPESFKPRVDDILSKIQGFRVGTYELSDDLYCDTSFTRHAYGNAIENKGQLELVLTSLGITNYKIHSDLTVSVIGNVIIEDTTITKLPITFKKISGNVILRNNQYMNTLIGLPHEIGGDFICTLNHSLSDMEGMSTIINGNCKISYNNKLKTLYGVADVVKRDFDCSDNTKLKTIRYSPKIVGGSYHWLFNEVNVTEDNIRSVCKVKGEVFV